MKTTHPMTILVFGVTSLLAVRLFAQAAAETPGETAPGAIPVATAEAATAAAPEAPPALEDLFADEGDYYLMRGTKIPLRRDTHRMAVKFKKNSATEGLAASEKNTKRAAALKTAMAVDDAEVSVERSVEAADAELVSVKFKKAGRLTKAHIKAAAQSPEVELAAPVFAAATGLDPLIATDSILVRFVPEYGEREVKGFCRQNGLVLDGRARGRLNIYVLRLSNPAQDSCLDTANALNGKPGVVWAQPNFAKEIKTQAVDPLYGQEWHLCNTGQGGGKAGADVRAEQAWAVVAASTSIVIAIVDTGVDLAHEDLGFWRNAGESGGGKETDTLDNDGNGYTNDWRGWDFYSNDNDPSPGGNHGTACAGVAAATGDNGLGCKGMAPGCRILPVKISSSDSGFATDLRIGEAIQYAARYADVISCSWGGSGFSAYEADAIDDAVQFGRGGLGTPVFCASGNGCGRGWTPVGLVFPNGWGTAAVGWMYQTVAAKSALRADRAWLDNVTTPDGRLETFDGTVPPALPVGWSNLTGSAANWLTVADASHRLGSSGNSLASGLMSGSGSSGVMVQKYCPTGGTNIFYAMVDAGEGGTLYATYWTGSRWVAYKSLIDRGMVFPASYTNSIAVGASDNLDKRACYSQYGPGLEFVAPSGGGTLGVVTTDRTGTSGYASGNYYTNFSGTSSATPLTAGLAALMLSANPSLTVADIRRILRETADDIETAGFDEFTGAGRINAYKAVVAAKALLPVGPQIGSRSPAGDPVYVKAGTSQAFSVTVSGGAGALSYRWLRNGVAQSGSSSSWTMPTTADGIGPQGIRLEIVDASGKQTNTQWQVLVGAGDPSLVGYWSFDGSPARDMSGRGNDLSVTGRVDFTWDGAVGGALRFPAP